MKIKILSTAILLATGISGCNNQPQEEVEQVEEVQEVIEEKNVNTMNSYVSLFEIPATDISRACDFYQAILDVSIEKMEMPGMEMGIFPYENQMVHGVIMKGPDFVPSADGPTLYLNGGNDLQPILDKVEQNGGQIIVPKTPHADESGFFALFLDSEGNKLGLNSPN